MPKKTAKKAKKKEPKKKPNEEKISTVHDREKVVTEDSDAARNLYNTSGYGNVLDNKKVQLSLMEALFLLEKGRIKLFDGKKKEIDLEKFLKKAKKIEPNFWIRYCVFKDIRERGYIIKAIQIVLYIFHF